MTAQPTRILGEDLIGFLTLLEDASSVELKLTVPEDAHRSTIASLGIDPLDAQIRQVFFFDTPELALNEAGVVARVRRVQGRDADSVVKLRPVVPAELPEEIRLAPTFVVEVDAMPGGYVCSGTLKASVPKNAVLPSITGGRRLSKLFTTEQRGFFEAHAPSGLALDDLSVLGPVFVLKGKLTPKEVPARIVVEMWLYPDGSRILELSSKSTPDRALQDAVRLRAFLEGKGIDTNSPQQTKTRTALDFYAAELRAHTG